jgi:predicted TIM-barrel fold metal-dependent hydrolase
MSAFGHGLVDAHIHLFTRSNGLGNQWLEEEGPLGPTDMLRNSDWGPDRLSSEWGDIEVDAAVHVQCSDGPDPIAETRWLAELAQDWPWLQAIVGRAELGSTQIVEQLEGHAAASALFRGVRDLTPLVSGLDPEAIGPGLAALAERELSWELQCVWEQMDTALECARRHEDLRIMLVHAGFPLGRDDDYRRNWEGAMQRLAAAPNVYCKLSGLGMGDHEWTVESWRPWLDACLEAFGVERCAFGSNFPVDRLYATYDKVLGAVESATADLSATERERIFAGTARDFYRIGG